MYKTNWRAREGGLREGQAGVDAKAAAERQRSTDTRNR